MNISLAPSPTSPRRVDLDWIRIIAFALLIFYHIGMYYVTWDWHVKSPRASEFIEPLMMLTSPWRLALLFLVSGAATSFMMDKISAGKLARSRSWRLLIPLIFGMLVIVPPQSYYEVVEKLQYGDGYLAFWARYLAGHSTFVIDNKRLITPTWNHLWFVVYLWAYTMLLAIALAISSRNVARVTATLERYLLKGAGWGIIVWPILILALCRLFLVSIFPSTHNLTHDWYNHSNYFFMFLFGFMFIRSDAIMTVIVQRRWLCLVLAGASYAFIIFYTTHYSDAHPPSDAMRYFQRAVRAVEQWCSILAILGFGRLWLNHDGPARRYFTDAIFPFYIVHQTAIVVYAHNLQPFKLPIAIEAVALIAATIATCFVSYEIVRRIPWLRPFFGLRYRSRQ
jgi:glucans biosynthesis protein C